MNADTLPIAGRGHYFVREIDKITLKDGRKICITNQWGRPIIGKFIDKGVDLGYDITQN